jgi:phospholipase C
MAPCYVAISAPVHVSDHRLGQTVRQGSSDKMSTRWLAVLAAVSGLTTGAPWTPIQSSALKDKIKNVVVLVEENRSFDTFAGGLSYNQDINGLIHTNYCNSMNASNAAEKADVCSGPLGWDVASDDPNHSVSGVNMQVFSTWHPDEALVAQSPAWKYENMRGFVTEQSVTFDTYNKTRAAEVMNYYPPEHIPVFNAMAENFVLFDRWFCSVPGPTNPNRAYLTSGTSYGHGENDEAFLTYGMPQKSIFQQLSEMGITWMNYENTTNSGFNPDAEFYTWTGESGANETNVKVCQICKRI